MRKLLAVLLVLLACPAYAQRQNIYSTKAIKEFEQALTLSSNFGIPRYATAALPTCNAAATGAIAFNTTTGFINYCNGATWGVANSGAASAITPASTTVGTSTNCFLFSDAASVLQCDNTLANLSNAGAGNGALTVRKTSLSALALGGGFFKLAGTLAARTSGTDTEGMLVDTVTGDSSNLAIYRAAQFRLSGYSGSSDNQTIKVFNNNTGTGTSIYPDSLAGPNTGIYITDIGTTTGTRVGIYSIANGGNINYSLAGIYSATKASAVGVGVLGASANAGATPVRVGVYGLLNSAGAEPPTPIEAAGFFTNSAIAAPLLVASDNGSALPTSGATATWSVLDGANAQAGNMVLTSGTMTAVNQAILTGSAIHSYEWTNAMVTALGAGGAGDISVATLPAKTVVKNAYVVILTPDTSANALTVACGRVSATYIDYIVASDAKAAANTVYGDTSGERGTNLTGYDLPSYTGTTTVNCHFIKTTTGLNTVLGSTGRVILETSLVP